MAKYRKIDPRIWNDEKFMSLTLGGKLMFVYILTHPNITMLGAMRSSIGGIIDELANSNSEKRNLKIGFRELVNSELVKISQRPACIWVPKFLKYNPPANPNVIQSWRSTLDLIPDCDLKTQLIEVIIDLLKQYPQSYRTSFGEDFVHPLVKGMGNGMGNGIPNGMGNSMVNQEQEQEQEQELITVTENTATTTTQETPTKYAAAAEVNKRDCINILYESFIETSEDKTIKIKRKSIPKEEFIPWLNKLLMRFDHEYIAKCFRACRWPYTLGELEKYILGNMRSSVEILNEVIGVKE